LHSASIRAEAEDDIRSNSQSDEANPNDANLQDLLDRVSIDPHNHPSITSKIDHEQSDPAVGETTASVRDHQPSPTDRVPPNTV